MFGGTRANAYYQGPLSDHFDGVRFFNPGQGGPKGGLAFLRWQFGDRGASWPASVPESVRRGSAARASRPAMRCASTYVGHASFLLQARGKNILVDPVWAERASPLAFIGPKRVNPPGIAFDDLPKIDAVLVTHNHYDHMDTVHHRAAVAALPGRASSRRSATTRS